MAHIPVGLNLSSIGVSARWWLEAACRAEAAGFEFVASSDHNYNPKDTHDHPNGVWTLPPELDAPEGQEARFRAIGESDRMTLLFKKLP